MRLLRSGLEMAGFEVVEASSAPEVLRVLEQNRADVMVASLDLPPNGGFPLLEAVRRQSGQRNLPAIGLTEAGRGPADVPSGGQFDFQDYQKKFDWEGMARSIIKLAAGVDHTNGSKTSCEEAPLQEVR